jgi:hypothetical protein
LAERGKRGGPKADDSASRFWEQVIVDWVSVGVAAFVLMGVWFGIASFLGEHRPELGSKLSRGSEKGMYLWAITVAISCVGLTVWRFVDTKRTTTGSRR